MSVLNDGVSPDVLNHTYIALIPKIKIPRGPADFRPISLCNVAFKIITKTIANRLKLVLPDILDSTQSAFMPGRLITDNALLAYEIFHFMKHNKAVSKGSYAFKLDMSKAYDRVEWDFLEGVMLKLGVCVNLVNTIMRCVRFVSFAVLVNGQPTASFLPTRGLRQGDPLSPYLFIFCAEALSSLIRKNVEAGILHGVRICRRAPVVSNLVFADDTIIFGRATEGQAINLHKSDIMFSKGITNERGNHLAGLLGVRRVQQHAIYLGVPINIGRSKSAIFRSLVHRVEKKLKDWKSKTLSQAGKLTLIKSVAQAIPTYLMSCFNIPEGVIDKIRAAIVRFWWGQRGEEKRTHWLRWEELCKPKSEGGIGLRDLAIFNKALLAKQGWRLIQNRNSLLARTLKARYFTRGCFENATVGYNSSSTWQAMLAERRVLDLGLVWVVGQGDKINIWTDKWIIGSEAATVTTERGEFPHDWTVDNLINPETSSWDSQYWR